MCDFCSAPAPTPRPPTRPPPTRPPPTAPKPVATVSSACESEINAYLTCRRPLDCSRTDDCTYLPPKIDDCASAQRADCALDSVCCDGQCVNERDAARDCVLEFFEAPTAATNDFFQGLLGTTSTTVCTAPTSQECAELHGCKQEHAAMNSCFSTNPGCKDCWNYPDFIQDCRSVHHAMCALETDRQRDCCENDECVDETAFARDCIMSYLPTADFLGSCVNKNGVIELQLSATECQELIDNPVEPSPTLEDTSPTSGANPSPTAAGDTSECASNTDCNDNIDCTVDKCSEESSTCSNIAVDNLCANGQYCDMNMGCQEETMKCTSNADCNDDIACTVDVCNADFTCANLPADNLCGDESSCDVNAGCIDRDQVIDEVSSTTVETQTFSTTSACTPLLPIFMTSATSLIVLLISCFILV